MENETTGAGAGRQEGNAVTHAIPWQWHPVAAQRVRRGVRCGLPLGWNEMW